MFDNNLALDPKTCISWLILFWPLFSYVFLLPNTQVAFHLVHQSGPSTLKSPKRPFFHIVAVDAAKFNFMPCSDTQKVLVERVGSGNHSFLKTIRLLGPNFILFSPLLWGLPWLIRLTSRILDWSGTKFNPSGSVFAKGTNWWRWKNLGVIRASVIAPTTRMSWSQCFIGFSHRGWSYQILVVLG